MGLVGEAMKVLPLTQGNGRKFGNILRSFSQILITKLNVVAN